MPFKKGNPGRLKGQTNLKSRRVEEIAAKLKCSPFEVLCLFCNGDWKALGYEAECYFSEKADGAVKMGYVISPDMRLQAAKEASKYLYAQRRAIEVTANEEQRADDVLQRKEAIDRIENLFKMREERKTK